MPLNTSQTVFLQVTVTADGLQARYIDQSKLDLPAITASARYRFCDYDKFLINSTNGNKRKKETQDVSAQTWSWILAGHAVEISEIYILEHCVPRSYLNIAQYEEVDSDEESVTNKFTRSVFFRLSKNWPRVGISKG